MFGIDGVLLALIITFIILFGAILSGQDCAEQDDEGDY